MLFRSPELFALLGCEVIPLYCDPDGNFPNHHPDPTRSENLQDLRAAVLDHHADLGIALDGDADRLGLVTGSGKLLNADHLLLAFAMDILPEHPDACVVFDVKSSHHLARIILDLQETDGSWFDYPFYDYHKTYGTAFAVMTLNSCRAEPKQCVPTAKR